MDISASPEETAQNLIEHGCSSKDYQDTQSHRENRLAKLKALHAPQVIIDSEIDLIAFGSKVLAILKLNGK